MPSSKTHIGFGFTTLIILSQRLDQSGLDYDKIHLFTGFLLGCTFPDLDSGKSWISSAVPWIDDFLRKIGVLKHRGILHSKWIGLLFIILPIYSFYNNWYGFPFILTFSIGVLSHILLDWFTYRIFRIRGGDKDKTKNAKKTALLDIGFRETWFFNLVWIFNIMLLIPSIFHITWIEILKQFLVFIILKFS